MGLDMYLYGAKIISDNEDHKIEEVMYWRKANQIHKWFVDNVQDGYDDCEEYKLSKIKLKQLIKDCKTVLEDIRTCDTIFPTHSGFFFGSQAYDTWYLKDIENTVEKLEPIIDNFDYFIYQSSW